MGIFSKNEKKEKLILVLDIRSSSVGGALFLSENSLKPKIIYSIRENIISKEVFNPDEFLDLTLKSLDTIVANIYKMNFGAPDKIFCILSSPWHISETRVINFEKNTPFIFTPKFVDTLLQKEMGFLKEESSNNYKDEQVRFFELKNIKVSINGYEVDDPINKKAQKLEINLFVSISPEQILNKIEQVINKHFNFKNVSFSSFILSSFTLVRDMYIDKEDFLLVDIGGEVTDVYMAKENILNTSASFPLGTNFLAREVASFLRCSLSEANSLVLLFIKGHLHKDLYKKIQPIIEKTKIKWLKDFEQSLAVVSKELYIPSTIYVILEKEYQDFFKDLIEKEEYSQYNSSVSKFKVLFLNSDILHNLASFKDSTVRDPFLIIDSVYINRFLK